jgi:hypothetical protein
MNEEERRVLQQNGCDYLVIHFSDYGAAARTPT